MKPPEKWENSKGTWKYGTYQAKSAGILECVMGPWGREVLSPKDYCVLKDLVQQADFDEKGQQ